MRRFTLLAAVALSCASLVGVASADTIACASAAGGDEERIVLDTRGFVTVSTEKGAQPVSGAGDR